MSKTTKEKLIKRAKKLYKREKFERCVKTSDKILKKYPEEINIHFLKMDALTQLKEYDKVKKVAKQYLSKSPKDESNYLKAAYYLDESLNKELSMRIVEEGLKKNPMSRDLALFKAKKIHMEGLDEGKTISEYVNSFPKTVPFWKDLMYILARVYREIRNHEKSLEVYNEILNYSIDLETLSRKIKTLKLLENDTEADEILDKMIAEDNEKNWALVHKGIYWEGKNNQKAIDYIEEAIENDPDYSLAYLAKASVLLDNDDYDDMEECIGKFLSTDKDPGKNSDFAFFLAKLNYLSDNPDDTMKFIKKIDYFDFVYTEAMELSMEIIGPKIMEMFNEGLLEDEVLEEKIMEKKLLDAKRNRIYGNSPRDSEYFKKLEAAGEDIEYFDNMPEERNPTTIEEFEEAINDFHTDRGEEYFEEYKGFFWGMLETRPYMDWLHGLSELLWIEGRTNESIDKLKYMLELNPRDNQGARHNLWPRLLELNRLDEFDEYTEMFVEDEEDEMEHSPFLYYNLLLSAIKRKTDEKTIKKLYNKAYETNRYVPDFLTGKIKLPKKAPLYYTVGDESEAIFYVFTAYNAWNDDEIAMKKIKELSK